MKRHRATLIDPDEPLDFNGAQSQRIQVHRTDDIPCSVAYCLSSQPTTYSGDDKACRVS